MLRHDLIPGAGKRLLFWDEQAGALQPLLDALGVKLSDHKYGQPNDHVRPGVRAESNQLADIEMIAAPSGM